MKNNTEITANTLKTIDKPQAVKVDKSKSQKVPSLKQCEIVTDQDKLKVDLQAVFTKYTTIKQWAYILHDKDETRPHYHIYLNFGQSSVAFDLVASWFDVPVQFISKVKGRKADMLLYLIHGNDSQKNKNQYDPSEVVSNFDFQLEIEKNKIIGDFEHYSYAKQLQYVNSLSVSEKTKAYRQLKDLWSLHLSCETLNSTRNIQVVFITGSTGTAKTHYAKEMLTNLGFDFCVSSSSNDPFQDYLGQDAIILDDLRDSCFLFADFLKIIDNHTSSSFKSRFANKVFTGKMIVITSAIPLCNWYEFDIDNKRISSIERRQLYRRIASYVRITKDNVYVYDELDENGHSQGCPHIYLNDFIKSLETTNVKTDYSYLFNGVCTPCPSITTEQIQMCYKETDSDNPEDIFKR